MCTRSSGLVLHNEVNQTNLNSLYNLVQGKTLKLPEADKPVDLLEKESFVVISSVSSTPEAIRYDTAYNSLTECRNLFRRRGETGYR